MKGLFTFCFLFDTINAGGYMLVCGRNVLKETDIKSIHKVYLKEGFKDLEILDYLRNNKIKFEFVPEFRLNKMTKERHQGVVIDINEYIYHELDEVLDEDFIVCLDHLEDPHNLGAIIRTCECAGIKSIIIPKERSVRVNDTVMKVSVGAINNVKIVLVNNLNNALNKLKKNFFFIYTADMDGSDYRKIDYAAKKVLVIGAEGDGVSRLVRENSDVIISIPLYGKINSLNASASAAILIYGMLGK